MNTAARACWLLIENHGNKLTNPKTIGNRWVLIIIFPYNLYLCVKALSVCEGLLLILISIPIDVLVGSGEKGLSAEYHRLV
jgi:hypothetical protein